MYVKSVLLLYYFIYYTGSLHACIILSISGLAGVCPPALCAGALLAAACCCLMAAIFMAFHGAHTPADSHNQSYEDHGGDDTYEDAPGEVVWGSGGLLLGGGWLWVCVLWKVTKGRSSVGSLYITCII